MRLSRKVALTDWMAESETGERVSKLMAVIGPNGSGKTTLLKPLVFMGWFISQSFQQPVDADIIVAAAPGRDRRALRVRSHGGLRGQALALCVALHTRAGVARSSVSEARALRLCLRPGLGCRCKVLCGEAADSACQPPRRARYGRMFRWSPGRPSLACLWRRDWPGWVWSATLTCWAVFHRRPGYSGRCGALRPA